MARRKKEQEGIQITNTRGETVIKTNTDTVIVGRKPKKGETIRSKNVSIQNNGNVGSQNIFNLDTVEGDLYL